MVFAAALAFAMGTWSCGGAAPVEVKAPAPKPRNAADVAQALVKAKVGVLVYVDRARDHAITEKIAALDLWQPVLEGTGIDPRRDLERAYVAAPSTRESEDRVVLIAQHTLTEDRIKAALDAMIAKSEPPGEWLADAAVPTARVTVRGVPRVIAMVEPSFIASLPASLAREAARFAGTGGFPDPKGTEAAIATAIEPSRSLKAGNAVRIPQTIRNARATVTLRSDGGADVAVDAQSESETQATTDAAELTSEVDRATSIKIAIVRIRLFDPIKFRAEADRVKADVHLSSGDVDKLFTLLSTFLPR